MSFGGPSEGEIRMALAEFVRRDEQFDYELRRYLRVVTGWSDATRVCYPGTSSEHERASVEVYCRTWDGVEFTYRYDGSFGYLLGALQQVVEEYGA